MALRDLLHWVQVTSDPGGAAGGAPLLLAGLSEPARAGGRSGWLPRSSLTAGFRAEAINAVTISRGGREAGASCAKQHQHSCRGSGRLLERGGSHLLGLHPFCLPLTPALSALLRSHRLPSRSWQEQPGSAAVIGCGGGELAAVPASRERERWLAARNTLKPVNDWGISEPSLPSSSGFWSAVSQCCFAALRGVLQRYGVFCS